MNTTMDGTYRFVTAVEPWLYGLTALPSLGRNSSVGKVCMRVMDDNVPCGPAVGGVRGGQNQGQPL